MQGNELRLFNKFSLTRNGNYNYSENFNVFHGNAYTSMAGNTYFNEIRLIEGILIKEDVGNGYAHTFINGIRVFDIQTKNLLCERQYHCTYYSVFFIKSEVKDMLFELLIESAEKENIKINISDVKNHVDEIVDVAFKTDQRKLLENQFKYLNA